MAKFPELEGAIVSLDNKVKVLTGDLQNLITTVNSNSKSQSGLATKTRAVGKATESLSALQKERANVAKQTQKVLAKNLALQEKGTKTLLKGKIRLREEQRKLNESLKAQLGIQKKSGGLFKTMTKSILTAGAAMFGFNAVLGVAKKIFGDAFNTIKDFEKSMSGVKAITNATDSEFKALVESAKELGSVTPKTASEVAGLQTEFAKLGFSTAEILNATEATISLSIAAGADLAQSAKVAASTIRGFGKSATETRRFVDVMAKSFSSSALDLGKFETAMSIAAPVANSFGKDIEFTTAQLGVLSDAGVDASTAGTSLRNIFLELTKRGLTWEEGLEKVNNSTNKAKTALNLFGKRGVTAALILAENTDKALELEDSLRKAGGAAKEMADIMADNLAGDIDKAKSAWEGLILSVEDGSGVLNKFFRGAVQSATKELGDLKAMFKGVSAAVEERAIESFDKFNDKLKETKDETERLSIFEQIRENSLARLEGATKKQTKAININLIAIDATIEKIKQEQQANEDSIKATEEAAAEQERVRTELAKGEAEKRAEARARIDARAAQRKADFINSQADDEFQDYEAFLERENALFEEMLDEQGEIKMEAVTTQLTAEQQAKKEAREKELQDVEDWEAAKLEIGLAAIDAGGKIVSDRLTAGIDDKLAQTLAGFDAEQALLDDKLDKGKISEEDYQDEVKAINLKARQAEAKANKKQAQYDNVINSLVAVGKTFATLGWPAGIIPAGIVAGIGLANGIAIAAEPIPKFKTGVKDFKGGMAYVHSGEIVDTKNGMFATPQGETLVNIPKGSDVLTAQQSAPILKDKSSQELKELKSINRKLSNNNSSTSLTWTGKGLRVRDKANNIDETYINIYRG